MEGITPMEGMNEVGTDELVSCLLIKDSQKVAFISGASCFVLCNLYRNCSNHII